ncbi:glycosyltransferase family 39 protein [Cylindrospermum sp. FACHB-282]|uniref:glycosyltransferase family 39 protein n=1 Tax=Cylindrospermum sp. FACHB-282 TaxID=2692794 RepID=UPI0016869F9F|nr:glycosyltransferase family 39 protein [Cylindrospermum sp. FACHB-282]MBD2385596.1 glycosyltransferase family 39 protein [Cylindrospermum sp. FACHB-282]
MNNLQSLTQPQPPTWLKALVICLLLLGILFRFANIGGKFYWYDESFTSLAISGHTLTEVLEDIRSHQEMFPISEFNKFTQITEGRTFVDTLRYLATSDPQHPPLYYLMVRLWSQLFGTDPAEVRSLSAVISLLIFPSAYWLCWELFNSQLVGWIVMAIMAVSPLDVFYAQEARQYCLWMVFYP